MSIKETEKASLSVEQVRSKRIVEVLSYLKNKGLKQNKIAEDLGITPQAITNWKKNGQIGVDAVLYLSEKSGYDIGYLLGKDPHHTSSLTNFIEDNMSDPGQSYEPDPFVSVPMVERFYSQDNKEPNFLKSLSFRRDWLEYIGLSPSDAEVTMIHGRSMEGALNEGDVVLLDKTDSALENIENGAIYALRVNEKPLIKYVYVQELGGVVLESENGSFKDIEIAPEEISCLEILGRVVWHAGEVKPKH